MKTIAVLTALLCMAAFCGCTAEDGVGNDPGRTDIGVSEPESPVVEPEPENPNGLPVLDAEIKRQIQQDLWDEWLPTATSFDKTFIANGTLTMEDKFPIPVYYGTYNGYAVIIPGRRTEQTSLWQHRIGGDVYPIVTFELGSPPVYFKWEGQVGVGIACWKDRAFYTLEELYKQGELTREDLLAMKEVELKLKKFGCS